MYAFVELTTNQDCVIGVRVDTVVYIADLLQERELGLVGGLRIVVRETRGEIYDRLDKALAGIATQETG